MKRFLRSDWLSAIAAATLLYSVICDFAYAAYPAQTLTISLTTQGGTLSATKCLSNADITSLQAAFASPLIAFGIPSPTPVQECAAATAMLSQTLNSYALSYLQGQATATAVAGVTFTGAK